MGEQKRKAEYNRLRDLAKRSPMHFDNVYGGKPITLSEEYIKQVERGRAEAAARLEAEKAAKRSEAAKRGAATRKATVAAMAAKVVR